MTRRDMANTNDALNGDGEGALLLVRGVSKSFPGVRALNRVHFNVRGGEVHALIGENGAGKSTLIKLISGVYAPDEGEIAVAGQSLPHAQPAAARAMGVQVVYQELDLVGPMTVAENICLGDFPTTNGHIDWTAARRRALDVMTKVGLEADPADLVEDLTVAEQQLVEIARALSSQVRVLILDEPTAALSQSEAEGLFAVIQDLKQHDVGIIYVSHRMEEIETLADRITVLRDGHRVMQVDRHQVSQRELVRAMVGRDVSELFPRTKAAPGEILLQVQNLSTGSGLTDVSFSLRAGEVLGAFGLVGSGLGILSRAVFGAVDPSNGSVTVAGRSPRHPSPRAARSLRLGLLTEDRKQDGLVLELSVGKNMTVAALASVSTAGWIRRRREQLRIRQMIERLRIRTPSPAHDVGLLSGGNQQKVLLARWLLTEPRVLLLTEPTRGVDVGAKAEVYKIIAEAAEQGMGVLILSTDVEEVSGICSRSIVLRRGQLVSELEGRGLTQEALLEAATGVHGQDAA